ncbi:MAG: hypothetical protein WD533_06335 [Dehalococcoidia bacterium]
MRSYTFHIQLEPDAEGFRAFYAPWEAQGASTWGETTEAALLNMREVLAMMIEEIAEEGRLVGEQDRLTVAEGPAVTVTV